jgi:hypothetical protein
MIGKSFFGLCMSPLILTLMLHAQVIPGRWDKVDILEPGTAIIVTLQAGERLVCSFKSSGPDNLTLTDDQGSERRLPKSEIKKIVSADKYHDTTVDGTASGAVIGTGVGALLGILHAVSTDKKSGIAPITLAGTGLGALFGYGADKSRQDNRVLYLAR